MTSSTSGEEEQVTGLAENAPSGHPPNLTSGPASSSSSSGGYRSDPILVRGCLDGEETAWKQLLDRYGHLVYSIPRRYGLSAGDSEDVFQDVFAIVLRQLPTLRDQTRLSAWLITITHRQTQRLIKHLSKSVPADEEDAVVEPPPLEEIHQWERRQQLHEAMSELDPHCRELLSALLQESVPDYKELAARLGMAVGSIGPTRARCFKKLEAILIALGFEP